ncbi:MAG TPA: hypothetical protein VNF74_04505 [Terriglobales bacterium]|nr:hypothetical protein [Terriglobales bacterium]
MHDHDANAAVPRPFVSDVKPNTWNEPWCGGLNVFHNPRALHALDDRVFSGCAQHFEESGAIRSYIPDFHPYGALCATILPTRLKP